MDLGLRYDIRCGHDAQTLHYRQPAAAGDERIGLRSDAEPKSTRL